MACSTTQGMNTGKASQRLRWCCNQCLRGGKHLPSGGANRGVLTSNLPRERRFNRARGILLELRGIGRHMQDWPPCELNTVHAALLNALEEVEGLMQPVGGTTPHMQLAGESMQGNILPSPSTTGGNPPAGEWWLQERHHGLGNAPGTDLRSPTEAMDSGSEESHRRR